MCLTLITCNTCCSYRTRDEIQNVRKTQDPIASIKEKILSADLVTEDELKVRLCYYTIVVHFLSQSYIQKRSSHYFC